MGFDAVSLTLTLTLEWPPFQGTAPSDRCMAEEVERGQEQERSECERHVLEQPHVGLRRVIVSTVGQGRAGRYSRRRRGAGAVPHLLAEPVEPRHDVRQPFALGFEPGLGLGPCIAGLPAFLA